MGMSDKELTELESLSIFCGFPLQIRKEFIENAYFKQLKHREFLYHAGDATDSFAIVTQGAFKLVRPTVRGDDVIVYFATAGDVIGALVMNKPVPGYPISAKSMGPSQALCIPRKTYLSHWSVNAEIQKRINSMLYTRMSLLQDDKTLTKSPLPQRISALLLGLLDRNDNDNTQTIPIPLTRQEIADSLGVTVESVIRVMSQWDHQGIIRTLDQRIEMIKLDQIVELFKQE